MYAGPRYPGAVIAHAVWLYFRFSLSLRMVEEMLAERSIVLSHETIRRWARQFGCIHVAEIRRRQAATGDKWHLDEVVISIGETHWLWRAVDQDQDGVVIDILAQSRRDARAAQALGSRRLMKRQRRAPLLLLTEGQIGDYCGAAGRRRADSRQGI